jgi:hypothetical protein
MAPETNFSSPPPPKTSRNSQSGFRNQARRAPHTPDQPTRNGKSAQPHRRKAANPQRDKAVGQSTTDETPSSPEFFNAIGQEQKFGCRELSKTTSACRDLAAEANASAGGSRIGRLAQECEQPISRLLQTVRHARPPYPAPSCLPQRDSSGRCHINWAGWKVRLILGWTDAPALL